MRLSVKPRPPLCRNPGSVHVYIPGHLVASTEPVVRLSCRSSPPSFPSYSSTIASSHSSRRPFVHGRVPGARPARTHLPTRAPVRTPCPQEQPQRKCHNTAVFPRPTREQAHSVASPRRRRRSAQAVEARRHGLAYPARPTAVAEEQRAPEGIGCPEDVTSVSRCSTLPAQPSLPWRSSPGGEKAGMKSSTRPRRGEVAHTGGWQVDGVCKAPT